MPARVLVLIVSTVLLTDGAAAQNVTLSAAGATFPYPLYSKWFRSFEGRHPGIRFDYQPIGSEAGIRELQAGRVDFAASDMPFSDSQVHELGLTALQFPTSLGAVVPIYHIQNLGQDLRFTPEILAGIFLGNITRWNDPAIRAANRGVSLPNREIAVFHRSDGSGTTFVLSDFLSKTSPAWRAKIGAGTSLHWLVGAGGEGNEGVAEKIQQTPDSIGYVEFIYALQNRLNYGLVRNMAGRFVPADLDSIAEAARSIGEPEQDLRVSITNAAGPHAYPIACFTYLMIPKQANPAKAEALHEFLQWMLSSGQKQSAALGYGALPPEVVVREEALLDRLQ